MPVKLFYNVFHEPAMGWLVAVYFFLSGLACGAFLVSIASRLWGKGGYATVERIGAFLTPPILAGGLLFLLLDLGKPLEFWRLIIHFNPTAVASWGVWMVNLFLICSVIYAWHLLKGNQAQARRFGLIGTPLAIAVSGYSGFILVQMKAYALWHSALLPVLFSVSAIASGIALVILGAILVQVEKVQIQRLGRFLAWFIAIDLVLVFVEMLTLLNGPQEAVEAARLLLAGAFSFSFLGLYVVLGLVIPLLILTRKGHTLRSEAVASALVLIGILAMRYAIVIGRQYLSLS